MRSFSSNFSDSILISIFPLKFDKDNRISYP